MADGRQERPSGHEGGAENFAAESREALHEQFIALAAHDLRTPLTTMRLAIDAWRKGLQEGADSSLRDLLRRNLAKTELRVEELAWLIRLRNSAFVPRRAEVDVNRLVQNVANSYLVQGLALGIKLEYAFADLPPVMADEAMLRQAILFVLAQALERLEAGQVAVLETEATASGIVLRIRDNNPSPLSPLTEILEGLAIGRISPVTRAGLYAAFIIIQAHAGILRAESGEADSAIWFWLPTHLPAPLFSASMRES